MDSLQKKLVTAFLLSNVFVFSICAANVSVLVIETGASEKNNIADLWEDGILDVLFEDGHIVSNAKKIKLSVYPNEEFPPSAINELNEARDGGIDYFVIAILSYPAVLKEDAKPERATLRLYRIEPYKFLIEKIIEKPESDSIKKMTVSILHLIGRQM
jgi:hypothetical protein